MRTLREHLRIAFSCIQPEALIKNLRTQGNCALKTDSKKIDLLTYRHFSNNIFKTLTYEEVDILYNNMIETIESRGKTCGGTSVFALIPEYTMHVLAMDGGEPVCRQDEMLNWRYCYLFLGQDFLAAAHLAYISVCENRTISDFLWPAQINTDERRLRQLLKKGLAENHFHLNGSSRSFDLSWICLMNHPNHIIGYFDKPKKYTSEKEINEQFMENLNAGISLGTDDNRFSWSKRLCIACWLRAKLFSWLMAGDIGGVSSENEVLFDSIKNGFSVMGLKNIVEAARFLYGDSRRFRQKNGKSKCLDYAITYDVLKPNDIDNCCRSLVGERAFLYKAFYFIYSGKFSNEHQRKCFMDMFYLYILIKIQFRNELIQVNGKYGFKNFAKYQDRKDLIFEKFPEYELEAKNLSVNESMKNGCVKSLEMRIAPRNGYIDQEKKIAQTDTSLLFLRTSQMPSKYSVRQELKNRGLDEGYFYVLHFPKIPESFEKNRVFEPWFAKPRNYQKRKDTRKQAFAIAEAMDKFDWLCTRIRGFDACTFEIGVRPEVFSTEFRFLRKFVRTKQKYFFDFGGNLQPKLCATYHVGEDFMDIVDGLRAIDEAIIFLELESGERLGHALALGVNPYDYYLLKHYRIILNKQDYLDNVVWALNKTQKLGISIDSNLKQELEDTANRLIFEIYGSGYTLIDYYNSWRLRGDDPELYISGEFDKEKYISKTIMYRLNNIWLQYNKHRIMQHYHFDKMKNIRQNVKATKLYSMYHFNYEVREKGEKTEEIKVDEKYIEMVNLLQKEMMKEIARHRLCIETNPSSNVLIGPFDRYEKHPIFRFYPVNSSTNENVQLVSVNTDDQGVFDTSLAMEYSLLACTIRNMKDDNHNTLHNDDVIFGYLEKLRQNGFSTTFPKAQ